MFNVQVKAVLLRSQPTLAILAEAFFTGEAEVHGPSHTILPLADRPVRSVIVLGCPIFSPHAVALPVILRNAWHKVVRNAGNRPLIM